MTTYRLVVMPDGHAILTSAGPIDPARHAQLADGLARWRASAGSTLILPDTDVVQVVDVQLDVTSGMTPDALAKYLRATGAAEAEPRASGGVVVPYDGVQEQITPASIDRAAFGLPPLEDDRGTTE